MSSDEPYGVGLNDDEEGEDGWNEYARGRRGGGDDGSLSAEDDADEMDAAKDRSVCRRRRVGCDIVC